MREESHFGYVGCVARKGGGIFASNEPLLLSRDGDSKEFGNDTRLASHISFCRPLHLPFPHYVPHLEALECVPCWLKRAKAHSRPGQPFDETVTLFNEMVELFHLPEFNR